MLKRTIYLEEEPLRELMRFYPKVPYSEVIRALIRAHLKALREKERKLQEHRDDEG